jgi:hypothetical protein
MHENYSVIDLNTGKRIADCATLEDAKMMVAFSPANRAYRKNRFIVDQVIDITSTTDKQLPGQLGLPSAKERLSDSEELILLPEAEGIPFTTK